MSTNLQPLQIVPDERATLQRLMRGDPTVYEALTAMLGRLADNATMAIVGPTVVNRHWCSGYAAAILQLQATLLHEKKQAHGTPGGVVP